MSPDFTTRVHDLFTRCGWSPTLATVEFQIAADRYFRILDDTSVIGQWERAWPVIARYAPDLQLNPAMLVQFVLRETTEFTVRSGVPSPTSSAKRLAYVTITDVSR